MYANEWDGRFPPLHHYDCEGRVATQAFPDMFGMYPEYMSDVGTTLCPSNAISADPAIYYDGADNRNTVWNGTQHVPTAGIGNKEFYPCEIEGSTGGDALSGDPRQPPYMYFGYAFVSEIDCLGTAACCSPGMGILSNFILGIFPAITSQNPRLLDTDIDVTYAGTGTGARGNLLDNPSTWTLAGDTIYRLREGIERFMIQDINNPAATALAQSELIVMADFVKWNAADFNHVPAGGNVLYMDGHVEFEKYPGKFPYTQCVAYAMHSINR
jgi:prepilin-type processing-associated H-X9-DG protein